MNRLYDVIVVNSRQNDLFSRQLLSFSVSQSLINFTCVNMLTFIDITRRIVGKFVNKNETSLKVKYIIFDYSASVLLIKSRLNFNQTRAKQKMIFFLKNNFIYSVIEATFSMLKKCSLFFFVPNH